MEMAAGLFCGIFYIKGEILFDDALHMVRSKKIVYAKDATMQAMLSDKDGHVLITHI